MTPELPTGGQRRRRSIAMTPDEVDDFLRTERTCRVASVRGGRPHVSPLWFLWHDGALWLNSVVDSRRWRDLLRDPAVAVVVDAGEDYLQLRGVELAGTAEVVGDVPRTAAPDAELTDVERLFAAKYRPGEDVEPDGRHAWLRVRPTAVLSWDHRKLR
jgi:nitroimidazol reductase NimA-like FMN-containing flavoprotein (pyridoxamine 5'-phosphate oxidase superfamily)